MDTLTHALSGAVLGRATAAQSGDPGRLTARERSWIGFLACAFPDGDIVVRLFTSQLGYLNLHRGVTHSLIMLPIWAVLLGGLFWWLFRRGRRFQPIAVLCGLAIVLHIAADFINSYGTQILAPLSDRKFAWASTFIIDPGFTAILVAGLLVSVWRESRRAAAVSLAVLALYVGGEAVAHLRAAALGDAYARRHALAGAVTDVFPQPLSPFNWKIVVSAADGYHIAYVNLLAGQPPPPPGPDAGLVTRVLALYQPANRLDWQTRRRFGDNTDVRTFAEMAWARPGFAGFRRFAALPWLTDVERTGNTECAWFSDLRFSIGELRSPFRYGMCREGVGHWVLRTGDGG
jgi:inner membrane protein